LDDKVLPGFPNNIESQFDLTESQGDNFTFLQSVRGSSSWRTSTFETQCNKGESSTQTSCMGFA
jgi:hypothetical protein